MSGNKVNIKRRIIRDDDLPGVIDVLLRGFHRSTRPFWDAAFARLAIRPVPEGCPRYGLLLEAEGQVVGALLMIYAGLEEGGRTIVRCSLSSWFVDPEYRSYAPLLTSYALKDKGVTYLNVSAAPNTWATIEAQGFQRFRNGNFLAFPALSRSREAARVHRVAPGRPLPAGLGPAEAALLEMHARFACTSLVVEAGDGLHPFVFAPHRTFRGKVPTLQLAYCRDQRDFVRFAGPIGRHLLARGLPSVLVDAGAAAHGLVGFPIDGQTRRYYRGPNPPRTGDLAFNEGIFLGP